MPARYGVRYLIAGGVNTIVTYIVYLFLLTPVGYRIAYFLAFILGIGLSFVLLRRWVFSRPGKPFALLYVGLSHVAQLVLGWLVIEFWVVWMQQSQRLAPLVAVGVSVPLMFLIQRWIFSPHANP